MAPRTRLQARRQATDDDEEDKVASPPPRRGPNALLIHRRKTQRNDLRAPPPPAQPDRDNFQRSGIFELLKLAPEIRTAICGQYFVAVSKHTRSTHPPPPSLLAAVRCRPDLYPEILEAYYKHYDFTLWSTEQEKDFDEPISMKLIRSMRHLTLEQMDLDKLGSQKIIRYDGDDLSDSDTTVRVGPRAPRRYFRDFIRHEWHNPSLAKIRQAMNLRKLVASIMMRGPTTAPSSDVLEFVDLMHLFFPLLEDVKVQVLNTESWPRKSLSLAKHEKEFETKKKVVYLNVYMEEKEKKNVGVGFECCWLAKDGKKKYFVMEESWSGDWIPVHLRARDSSFLAKVE